MHIHDVLIVGAGPSGLAVAARLREDTPSATFTDDEHQRYYWIRKHGQKMNIKNYRTNTDSLGVNKPKPQPINGKIQDNKGIDMLVLDADGADWMSKWHRLFRTFGIEHLRSPMFFHVDPADRDALLGYAYENSRESELLELPGCAGKEVSKHRRKKLRSGRISQSGPDVDERDRKDYYTPSTKLFRAHCEGVVHRYELGNNTVRQEVVTDIEYNGLDTFVGAGYDELALNSENAVFRVSTDKAVHFAHAVVLAIGPGNTPSIPKVIGIPSFNPHEGCSHAMHHKEFPPPCVMKKIARGQPTSILIVGGGLTSIQLADLALKCGVGKIWLLMRGGVKVKYFDIDLNWVGKFRNYNQATFWSADTDDERAEMYFQARNGGSITPRYRKILDAHVASGRISLHTHTQLTSVEWDTTSLQWKSLQATPAVNLPSVDYITFATGIQTDTETIPFLKNIRHNFPIDYVGGLPCLTDDMMWNDSLPLFVTGRLAGLRLGPGAPNLVGARIGAERIAWNVDDILKRIWKDQGHKQQDDQDRSYDEKLADYAAGRQNRFDSLVGDCDS